MVDITDGSDQGYMRIGNMQIVWGVKTHGTDFSFPSSFSEIPMLSFATNCVGQFTVSKTELSDACNSGSNVLNFIAIGKWQ